MISPSLRRCGSELSEAGRRLLRARSFSLLAIAMLTLGIGANVAVYSVFSSIVLEPLPYPDAGRLMSLSAVNPAKAIRLQTLSLADFRDLKARATSFTALAAFRPDFTGYAPPQGDPVQLVCGRVTEEFLAVFEVAPHLGRGFRPDEFSVSAPRVAVLSHNAWRRHFEGRADVIGRTVMLDNEPTLLIGVMPDHFREPEFAEIWLPFPVEAPENLVRDSRFWWTVGRPRAGSGLAKAQAEVASIAAALAAEYPATNRGWEMVAAPLLSVRVAGVKTSLLLLGAAVGLLLLVVCVNLASLLLGRGIKRTQEMAIRLALGATPVALARGVLLESVLRSAVGALAGLGLAQLALRVAATQLPAGLVPRSHAIGVHGGALLFAVAIALVTAVVFGLLPALHVLKANVNEVLKSGGTRGSSSRHAGRAQSILIAGEVALTLVVLAGAALLVRSLVNLQRADLGFDPRGVTTLRISPPPSRWRDFTQLADYYQRVLVELRQTPGVEEVSLNCSSPLSGIALRYPFTVQGRPTDQANADEAVFNAVSEDYLRVLGVPLVRGRWLEEADNERGRPVCVINQTLVRRIFGGQDPIGQRIRTVPWLNRGYREIVGVVADVKQESAADAGVAQIYVPQRQSPWFFTTVLVRGSTVSAATLQAAVRRVDPTLTMSVSTLEQAVARASTEPRLRTILFSGFAVAALVLSAFGMYATVSFHVGQRTREIGVRMALGATPAIIFRWVLGRAAAVAGIGTVAGLAFALATTHLLRNALHGISANDPLLLAGLGLLVPLIVLGSALWPARRAAALSPTEAIQLT